MNGITVLRATFGAHLADFLEGAASPARLGPSLAGPIILLHGFAGWSRGLLPLERHLRAATGREVVRLRLGAGLDGIEPLAQRAAESIERIAAEWRGRAVDVVGHSMGGLVATYAAKHLDRSARVRRVLTLGTPHRGTALALSGARYLGRVAGSLAQMVPGCAFLADLDRATLPEGVSLVSIAGLGDLVVPAQNARLPRRARHHNRSLSGCDHLGLVYDVPAQRLVANLLRGMPLAPRKTARPVPRARRIQDGRDRLRVVE